MDKNLQEHITRFMFGAMHANMALYESFNIPVISTTRPFRFYRKALFDNQDKQQIKQQLKGKKLVDVGCGLTPFIEDSMFQWCRRNDIEFYGVDPKVKDGFKFGLFDRLKSMATGAKSLPNPEIEGLDRTIASFANELPFDDNSIDIVLSCWLIFSWLRDDEILTAVFQEFDRILKPGGSIRIYPTESLRRIKYKYPKLSQFLDTYHIEQQFMASADLASMPPSFSTKFMKPY